MNTWSKWIFVLICCLAVTVGCSESVSSIDDEENDDAENQVESNDESDNDGQNDNQGDDNDNQGDDNDEPCESPTDDELCNAAGFQCGDFETTDKCGVERSVDCGGCPLDDCENNMCGCVPDTCKDLPNTCGVQDDGCGGHVICNTDCENAIGLGSYHTCLMTEVGGVECWGQNEYAQLGNDYYDDGEAVGDYSNQGVDVEGLDVKIEQIHAGEWHSCAKDIDGAVYCWGYNDTPFRNQLTELAESDDAPCGDGERVPCAMEMTNLSGAANVIGTGGLHTCAEIEPGHIECFGHNGWDGTLGTGTDDIYTTPQVMDFVGNSQAGIEQFDGGPMNSCYIDGDGDLFCWGNNIFGQIGNGERAEDPEDDVFYPMKVEVDIEPPIVDMAVGGVWDEGSGVGLTISGHVCAVESGGAVKCWGHNRYSQLAAETTTESGDPKVYSTEAIEVDLPANAQAVAAGGEHSCAVVDGGDVYCWGFNEFGQLGVGEFWEGYAWWTPPEQPEQVGMEIGEPPYTNQNPMDPMKVQGLDGVAVDIFAGTFHTCALMEEGDFQCWGLNQDGQLGDGTLLDRPYPESVFDGGFEPSTD